MCSIQEERNCTGCGVSRFCDWDVHRTEPMPCNNDWCKIPPSMVCHCVGTGKPCEDCEQKFCEENELNYDDYVDMSDMVEPGDIIETYWEFLAAEFENPLPKKIRKPRKEARRVERKKARRKTQA